jgi:electron transport complex protein RnfD
VASSTVQAVSSASGTVDAASSASVDAVAVATPLAPKASGYTLWQLFSGNIPGMLGETCKLTLLLGGIYLIIRRVIDWRIPVSFIGTAFLLFLAKYGVVYSVESGANNALYQLLSGGLILGAFFMATDYVTSPISKWGRVIMGVGCALILFLIRNAGTYPEGCSFAILFMNVLTPMIDKFTTRKPFGTVKPAKGGAQA